MKKNLFYLLIISALVIENGFSQQPATHFIMSSKYIQGTSYPIDIILPDKYDSTHRYPIVYCTDWWMYSYILPGIVGTLNFEGDLEPIILVGIGTEGVVNDWMKLRSRDLTPTHIQEFDMSDDHTVGKAGVTGGAGNFLLFIRKELIPTIETKYLSDTLNRGFIGYSYGGLFGTYILVNNPGIFKKYFIGSPALWWDNYSLVENLKKMPVDKFSSVRAIYLTIGELEGGNMLKSFADIRDCLIEKKIPSLKIGSVIVTDEKHVSAVPAATLKAVRFMYGK